MIKYRLTDLEIDEVSFVNKGANPLAKVVFSKRQQPGEQPMEENSVHLSKSDQILISKIMSAVAKQDYSTITRDECDHAIEAAVRSIMSEGSSLANAYQALMDDDIGKSLYAAREACPPIGTGAAVQKAEVSKAEEMERAAEHFSQAYNVPLEEARKSVADYYQQ